MCGCFCKQFGMQSRCFLCFYLKKSARRTISWESEDMSREELLDISGSQPHLDQPFQMLPRYQGCLCSDMFAESPQTPAGAFVQMHTGYESWADHPQRRLLRESQDAAVLGNTRITYSCSKCSSSNKGLAGETMGFVSLSVRENKKQLKGISYEK